MTNEHERTINRAIALLPNEEQEAREAARTALHHLNGQRAKLEDRIEEQAQTIISLLKQRDELGRELYITHERAAAGR